MYNIHSQHFLRQAVCVIMPVLAGHESLRISYGFEGILKLFQHVQGQGELTPSLLPFHKSIATLPRQTGRTKWDLADPDLPGLNVIWPGPHRYSPFFYCTSMDGQLVTALFTFLVDCGFC
jgi:hypothetical protein